MALLSLALVCWTVWLLFVFSVAGKEVHGDAVLGQAYAWFFAMGFAGLTWLWIGGLLLKAGIEDVVRSGGIVLVLYLASGAAGAAAMFLLIEDVRHVWPVAILVLLPAVLIFYVFALYQPSLRPLFSGPLMSVLAASLVLVLCTVPLLATIPRLGRARGNSAAVEQEAASRNREENLQKLQAMPADAPLWDLSDLLQERSGVRTEALEAVRRLERRQKDIEGMLEAGVPRALPLIPDLDLQPTAALCEAAGNYLRKYAKESRVRPKQDPRAYSGAWVEESLPALRWLISRGCDCDATVAAMEASVGTFLDTPARKNALAALAELRKK